MKLEKLIKTERFLEEISLSIRIILLTYFPELTEQDKEDIDHDVKLKLWRKLARGKKITNLRSYLRRVVYTTALDVVGERMNSVPLYKIAEIEERKAPSALTLHSLDSAENLHETKSLIDKAVGNLSTKKKSVLSLHFSGLNIKQIAASLGWREAQVRHLLYRGLSDLRQILKEQKG